MTWQRINANQWPAHDQGVPSGRQVIAVLLGAGAVGFYLGMVWQPTSQDALEPAQVLAGLVNYPPQNPVYVYSTRTWTVVNQALALLLYAGFSERSVALLLSGVLGMLAFQALGVLVLALSRDVSLAILSPFFIYFTNAASGGVTYPVALIDTTTYGVVGLSYLVLTLALLGAGQARAGALLLGFGPAIHPTIGALGAVVVAIAIGIGPGWVRQWLKGAWPYFLAGAAAAAVCAFIHLRADPAPPARYLSAFVQHWDGHRRPFPLVSPHMAAVGLSTGLFVLWMWRFRDDIPAHAGVLLRIVIVATVLGGTLSGSYWLIPATEPHLIPGLMPSRLLNVGLYTCMALIIGLSGCYRRSPWIQWNLAVLVVVLLAVTLWLGPSGDQSDRAAAAWAGMGVSGLTLALLVELRRRGVGMSEARPGQLARLRRATLFTIATVLAAVCGVAAWDFEATARAEFPDWTNDPLLAAAAGRPGLLLTASNLHLVQLQTRRPVLLDGGTIDALLPVPDAAPEADRILQRVYGTDLLSLQQAGAGALSPDTARALWEARTPAEWQHIGREFGVTDVITYPGWTLQLPVIASSADYMLYGIPSAAHARRP